MKKINVLQLITLICFLLIFIINLLDILVGIPFAVYVTTIPLGIVAFILSCIVIVEKIKLKKNKQNDDSN